MKKLTKKEIETIKEYRELPGLTLENVRFIEKLIHQKNKPSSLAQKTDVKK